MQLAEDREIDVPIGIHQIAQHTLLSSAFASQLVRYHRHIERQRQFRVLAVHHDRQQIVIMDIHLVLLLDILLLQRDDILQVNHFLGRCAGGTEYHHAH